MPDTYILFVVEHRGLVAFGYGVGIVVLLLVANILGDPANGTTRKTWFVFSGVAVGFAASAYFVVYLTAFAQSERVAWLLLSNDTPDTSSGYVRFAGRFPQSDHASFAASQARELQRQAIENQGPSIRAMIYTLLYEQSSVPARLALVVDRASPPGALEYLPYGLDDFDASLRHFVFSELSAFAPNIHVVDRGPVTGTPTLALRYWAENGSTYQTFTYGRNVPAHTGTTTVPRLAVQMDIFGPDRTRLQSIYVTGEGRLSVVRESAATFTDDARTVVLDELRAALDNFADPSQRTN